MGATTHLPVRGRWSVPGAWQGGDVRTQTVPLYWKVCLINGAVFLAGTVALLFFPVSVSRRPLVSEAVVLTLGLGVMLVTNALLLRASLAPIDRVVRQMAKVDLLEPGQRLPVGAGGPGGHLVASFNAMLDRLESERSSSDTRALAAEEEERHRIARELHDEVGQQLTVVLLGLKQVQQRALPSSSRSWSWSARARAPGSTTYGGWRASCAPGSSTTWACTARSRRWRRGSPRTAGRRYDARSRPACPRCRPRPSWWSTGWPRRR